MAAQTGTKTYRPSFFDRARLIIALIAGTVVGLFNNFTQGVSVSPLAIAFLVGYAVEVFFSFLDAFVHTFERVRDPEPLAQPESKQSRLAQPEIVQPGALGATA
jgi:xanthine/uracil permease